MKFYSFADIRASASCHEVAQSLYGCAINNNRCAAKWRGGDNPESVAIERDKYYDHVAKEGGDVIKLASHAFGGDIQQAQDWLGEQYNLQPRSMTRKAVHESRHAALIREGYTEVARHNYHDADGNLVHFVARLEHQEKRKQFVQGTPKGWGIGNTPTILYNLGAIYDSPYVIITEGEKCADLLIEHDLPATTCAGGAKKWRPEYREVLSGKMVAILPDNDEPGRAHAELIAAELTGHAAEVRIVQTSTAPKGDVYNYIMDEGHTIQDVLDLIADAQPYTPGALAASKADKSTTVTPEKLAAAKTANAIPFRNFVPVEVETTKRGKKTTETSKEPRTHAQMVDDLNKRFLGFPRKVGDEELFDHDRDSGRIVKLNDTDSLMAWIGRRSKRPVEWSRGETVITQRQFLRTVQAEARRYESISLIPSWPPRDDVYYAHETLPPPTPNLIRFNTLIDMFAPASHEDRCLIAAMICAPLWYVPGVARPSWIIDSRDGQGSGKTTFVELVAQLYGHAPISTTRNEMVNHLEVVKKRCVSSSGRDARVFLVDNATGDFHCDELSAMITAKDITGMAPYGRGEETRPNDLTYCITANSATVSTDLSDRSLYIFLRKPDNNAISWREQAQNFIEQNRLQIVADIIHMLETHRQYDMPTRTRFREFETRILQPCCGSIEDTIAVLDHVAGCRQDSNLEEDQARTIAEVFEHELSLLGITADSRVFIRSEVCNTWGRRAINEANDSGYKGHPIQLIRNLAKAGFLPQVNRSIKRLEKGKGSDRERHSGLPWNMPDQSGDVWLVYKDGSGMIKMRRA
jgi:hypothetical protein